MSYADRIASNSKPACWGSDSYDITDVECESCRWQHSCRQEQSSYRSSVSIRRPSSTSYTPRRSRDERDVASSWKSGAVGENEKPIERFLKDAVAGAMRGMFYEMYSFWKEFRIR